MIRILKFNARKIKNMKASDVSKCESLVAAFISETPKEKGLLQKVLLLLTSRPDRTIDSNDLRRFRTQNRIPKTSLWRALKRLEHLRVVKAYPFGAGRQYYRLSKDFGRVLYKVGRCYRRLGPRA